MTNLDDELKKCIVDGRRSLGGQHTNGPDYCVRLYHPDYSFEVVVEHERERKQNLELAMSAMKVLLILGGVCEPES